jgi:hypothetical protein
MRPTTRRARHLAAATLLTLAPLASCTTDDDDPPSPTPTTLTPEAEVEAAYLAYWDMAERLSESPDPENSEISQRSIDPVRAQLTETLSTYRARGQAVRSGPDYRHRIADVEISGGTATLQDCAADDSALIDVTSGEVIEHDVVTTSLQAVLVSRGDEWLLQELNSLGSWRGVVSCGA